MNAKKLFDGFTLADILRRADNVRYTPARKRPPAKTKTEPTHIETAIQHDLRGALLNLGYQAKEIRKALDQVRGTGSDFDSLLRAALQILSGGVSHKRRFVA